MSEGYKIPHLDIVDRCRKGERQAQYELYKLYSKAMLNVAYRIVNDVEDAEDVLQDAFVSAFTHIDSYKATATVGSWLKRIVVNKAINHLKRRRLELQPYDEMGGIADTLAEPEDTDSPEHLSFSMERIRAAVQQLPDGFRVVFSLYLLEGYDHREIAQILGITESTSKSQFNRAKKKLREALGTGKEVMV